MAFHNVYMFNPITGNLVPVHGNQVPFEAINGAEGYADPIDDDDDMPATAGAGLAEDNALDLFDLNPVNSGTNTVTGYTTACRLASQQ